MTDCAHRYVIPSSPGVACVDVACSLCGFVKTHWISNPNDWDENAVSRQRATKLAPKGLPESVIARRGIAL